MVNNTDRRNLDQQISQKFSFGKAPFSPLYSIKTDVDEEIIGKVPVIIKLPQKPDRSLDIPDFNIARFSHTSRNLTVKPYETDIFDGVLFITNKRLIVHFIEMFKEHDVEIELKQLEMRIENKKNLHNLTTRFRGDLKNIESEPSLRIGKAGVEVFLLDCRKIIHNGSIHHGQYSYARYSTYMAIFEAVEYAKGNITSDLKHIWTKMYVPDRLMLAGRLSALILFPLMISVAITMWPLILPRDYSNNIITLQSIAFIYTVISIALMLAYTIFIFPGTARKFQQKLIDESGF